MIVDIRNYHIIEKLGQGSFGTAYKVLNKNDNKFYVLKQIFLQNNKNEEFKLLQKEANILSKLNCEYIVKYFDSFSENNCFCIIMEFCEGLDLRKFIEEYKAKNKTIEKNLIYNFIKDLLEGIKYIHDNNIIHRDLKPDNIFINKNNKLKIGDFGISIKLNDTRYATSKVGTYIYMAPEIIKGEKYNNKVDIWSLGCIIYELCTLNYCFFDTSIFGLCNKIVNEKHGKIDLNKYENDFQNLIDNMLNKNYKIRPNINEVYNSFNHIFNKINKILSVAVFGLPSSGKSTFCEFYSLERKFRQRERERYSQVPESNIIKRCGVKCDFIDTSYCSRVTDSLKAACDFLKSKKEIDYIIILLKIECRITILTREYIKCLCNLFNPTEFFTHLCFVFTHSRFDDKEEKMESKKNWLIKEISNIVNDNANIKEKNIASGIKVYFMDISEEYDYDDYENKKAKDTFDNIIEEIKLNVKKYPPINTENLIMKGEFEHEG